MNPTTIRSRARIESLTSWLGAPNNSRGNGIGAEGASGVTRNARPARPPLILMPSLGSGTLSAIREQEVGRQGWDRDETVGVLRSGVRRSETTVTSCNTRGRRLSIAQPTNALPDTIRVYV